MVGAMLALLAASATVLGLGQGLRRLVDDGFKSGNAETLDHAVLALIGVVVLLAASAFCRFYLVSWIGERVVADIRRAVFDRVIALSSAYFEVHRTGDILSRLTTDTTLLQTVIGSTVSQALRNALLLVGGLAMLAVTSVKLTLLVLLIVPVVIVPILFYGRRVRRLSRDSQDTIAAFGAYAEETINAIRTVQAFRTAPVSGRSLKRPLPSPGDGSRCEPCSPGSSSCSPLGRSRWFSGSAAAMCWLGGSAPAICRPLSFMPSS